MNKITQSRNDFLLYSDYRQLPSKKREMHTTSSRASKCTHQPEGERGKERGRAAEREGENVDFLSLVETVPSFINQKQNKIFKEESFQSHYTDE